MEKIAFPSADKMYSYLEKNIVHSDYFLGEFLHEIDKEYDELAIIISQEGAEKYFFTKVKNDEVLPKFSNIRYAAHIFENGIYDFYGKEIQGAENHILKLHHFDDNYFPKRKLGTPMITKKESFKFTPVHGEGLVEVQVGPIHAGVIGPGHFRFFCDGEDIINLDIQLGWKYKGIEAYFSKEKDLQKLITTINTVVGDSTIAYARGFLKNIEASLDIQVDDITNFNRIVLLEIERIYNHLLTLGAMLNDVGQSSPLNTFLSVREDLLALNEQIFGSRLLKNLFDCGQLKKYIQKQDKEDLLSYIKKTHVIVKNILHFVKSASGIYDRFVDTGVVTKKTAHIHSALGVAAKASGLEQDYRRFDDVYKKFDIEIHPYIGKFGDVNDRFRVRAHELESSFTIIQQALDLLEEKGFDKNMRKKREIKKTLKDGIYLSRTEGHRGEVLQIMYVSENEIKDYTFKDPSFVNWTLLEYAVLNNIIADFPICNKSFDFSYSGFDL